MVGCLHNKQGRKYRPEKWQESLPLPLNPLSISLIRYFFVQEIFNFNMFLHLCDKYLKMFLPEN